MTATERTVVAGGRIKGITVDGFSISGFPDEDGDPSTPPTAFEGPMESPYFIPSPGPIAPPREVAVEGAEVPREQFLDLQRLHDQRQRIERADHRQIAFDFRAGRGEIVYESNDFSAATGPTDQLVRHRARLGIGSDDQRARGEQTALAHQVGDPAHQKPIERHEDDRAQPGKHEPTARHADKRKQKDSNDHERKRDGTCRKNFFVLLGAAE